MAGARINVQFDHRTVSAALDRLAGVRRNPKPLMRAIGLLHTTRDRFRSQTDPTGKRWAPLNTSYAAIRRPGGILQQMGDSGGLWAA